MTRYFLFLILGFVCLQLKASHLLGAEVTYRHLGGLQYELTFKVYRDCRGISLNTPTAVMIGNGDTSKKRTLSLTLVSIRDITFYCKDSTNPCNPQNKTISSGTPAQEEHVYKDTVDFNKADSALKKYCNIRFGVGQCCRPGAITTGPSNNDFWVYSDLYLCRAPNNSSPVLTNVPVNILCCNQPLYTNLGAADTLNYDSLSYSFASPQTGWTTFTTWSGPRSAQSPFSDYWPSGYNKAKGPNPNLNPPIGTYLDPETGDLIFTPTDCSEFTVACIKISEWRKDSTGKYQLIGEVRRDVAYIVMTCPYNNPPTLNGPHKYEVCAGQKICFNVNSDDKVYVPPPPGKTGPPDTVLMSWNHGIGRAATFTVVNPKARAKQGQFCWTPKESDASDLPYYFTVSVNDNHCPKSEVTTRAYMVRVKKIAKASVEKKFIKNGMYSVTATLPSDFKGTPSYFWEVYDSSLNRLDTNHFFKSTNYTMSRTKSDTLQFYQGGKYILRLRMNSELSNCPVDYFDTLEVSSVVPFLSIVPKYNQQKWICKNNYDTLKPKILNGKAPIKIRWSTSPNDTLAQLVLKVTKDSLVRIDVRDADGYHRYLEWRYFFYAQPTIKMGPDLYACEGDSVYLSATILNYTDTLFWRWKYDGKLVSTDIKPRVAFVGTYTLEVNDTKNCFVNPDSIKFRNMLISTSAGPDRKACQWDTVMLNARGLDTSNGKTGKYLWFYGGVKVDSGTTVAYASKSDGNMVLKLVQTENKLTCFDLDTVTVLFRVLPEVLLKDRVSLCQSETLLNLDSLILKPVDSQTGFNNWELAKTLKKPSGFDNTSDDLIFLKDSMTKSHHYLKIGKTHIDLNGKFMDSLQLLLTHSDSFGCVNMSTNKATVVIKRVVDAKLINHKLERCYADLVNYLSNDYGVNYYGGIWFSINDSGTFLKWPQGHNVQLSEKLSTTNLDPKGGNYLMKYVLESNKCSSSDSAILVIIPFPTIAWGQVEVGDSLDLTDLSTYAERREWHINSKKMSEAKSIRVSKIDALEKAIYLKTFNAACQKDSLIKPKVFIGIHKNKNLKFSILPNPVQLELVIKTVFDSPYTIEIINGLGKIITTKSFNKQEEILDVSEFANGIYSINLKIGDDIYMQRFVKISK